MDLVPWMEQWNMFPESGGIILCAVSGGRDSICLLHYLYELSKERDFHVAAAHLNHMMRTTAERDENFVRAFCKERGIPFYLGMGDVYGKAKEWNVGTEESGRKLRYDFLEQTARDIGATRIATAHHLGDQAETVILNLVRGTGTEGLGGIPPVRGKYIRPLLTTSRKEIETYNQEQHLSHVEDETNTNQDYSRNLLRLTIWPELERINPSIQENVGKASAIVRKENQFLNDLAQQHLPKEGTQVDIHAFDGVDEVLQARMVRLLMNRLPSGKKDVGRVHIESVLQLIHGGGVCSLPGNMEAVCRDGKLKIAMKEEQPSEQILRAGENHWGNFTVILEKESRISPNGKDSFFIACGKIRDKLLIRQWEREDRLTLVGAHGERSLKRLFLDAKIPAEKRNQYPVICDSHNAIAVYEVGQDKEYIPSGGEESILITIRKDEEEK